MPSSFHTLLGADRFFSGVRAIGYQGVDFLVARRGAAGGDFIFVKRGLIERRYPPATWVEEALTELRAGVFGRR